MNARRQKKKRKVAALLRAEIRDMMEEARRDVAAFGSNLREMTEAARLLSARLFDLSVHQAHIRDAASLANQALQIASSLRFEWGEAKALAKIFEQREFLGLPMVREARAKLANSNGMRALGAGEAPDPETKTLRAENERLRLQLTEREQALALLGSTKLAEAPQGEPQ